MYYEFVLESDKGTGFSIVSADERIPEMLCYSEVGAISDTSFNKSLKFCLELLDLYVEDQTKDELAIEVRFDWRWGTPSENNWYYDNIFIPYYHS